MIDEIFLMGVGLTQDQTDAIMNAVNTERIFQRILCEEGISPLIAEKVLHVTTLDEVDVSNLPLLRLKIRETWEGFMKK